MTLAEKIKAVVRAAFPCESEGKESCAYNFTKPMPGHSLTCCARFAFEALGACHYVANLAIAEAVKLTPHDADCKLGGMNAHCHEECPRANIRALALSGERKP